MKVLWGDPGRDDEKISVYRRAFSVQAGSPWQRLRWIAPYGQLLRLMQNTRRRLGQVRQPVLIIQSRGDETVCQQSAEILKWGLGSASAVDVLMLDGSGHSYHHPDEVEALYTRICNFVRDRIKQA
jgi:esterase/lipase